MLLQQFSKVHTELSVNILFFFAHTHTEAQVNQHVSFEAMVTYSEWL